MTSRLLTDLPRARAWLELFRLHRIIGALLLLWPTLWALWLAGAGHPSLKNVLIFVFGVLLTRSAGCAVNDYADRGFDAAVKRTRDRPLADGRLKPWEALIGSASLFTLAFALVLLTNPLTIKLSLAAILLAGVYPFAKRYTYFPQIVLGAAFGWGIPMAFAAEQGAVPPLGWLVFTTNMLWVVVYDTQYAMVDRDDDLKIGIKSTAILFAEADRAIIALLQLSCLAGLALMGARAELGASYFYSLIVVAVLFAYQQWLIRERQREACFRAFLNNNWVGGAVFVGLVLATSGVGLLP